MTADSQGMRHRPADRRGIVLVLVLWTVGLLALIGARLTGGSRTDLAIAARLVEAAAVEAAADGAVHEAILRLADGGGLHWPADRVPRITEMGGVRVDVTIENLAGRLNPNTAPAALMAALLFRLGMPGERALAQGAALQDWRMPGANAMLGGRKQQIYRMAGLAYGPPGQSFEQDDEIEAAAGMTPEVAAALRPFLSIHNGGAIDPLHAAPALRQALEDTGINQLAAQTPAATVEILALARAGAEARFIRRAIVRFTPGRPVQFLAWGRSE